MATDFGSKEKKRDRGQFEGEQIGIQTAIPSRIRFTRMKDVGTRLNKIDQRDQRNKNIIQAAKPLPEGNKLNGRSVYWFITTQEVILSCQDTKLFEWKERTSVNDNGSIYFLNQVDFAKAKNGKIGFTFPDGVVEYVLCSNYTKSKKQKLSSSASGNAMQIDDDQSAVPSTLGAPQQYYGQGNNTNQLHYSTADTPPSTSFSQSPSSSVVDHGLMEQFFQSPPQPLSNGNTLPPGAALIVNILLLVPDKPEHVQMVERVLLDLKFVKEASCTNQSLFSQNLNNTTRHVLVFPYATPGSLFTIKDYVPQTSEFILLLENEDQQNDFMVIGLVTNMPSVNNDGNNQLLLSRKATFYGVVQLDCLKLNPSVRLLFSIGEFRNVILGGASWKKSFGGNQLADSFTTYFMEWTLPEVTSHSLQNIYICFRFTPERVKALTWYAAASLNALGIPHDIISPEDAVPVNGSVLVYFRCPSYITWYILQRKDHIFKELRKEGLIEVYEAFISDIETSMRRPENKEFLHELTHLQEQMISDNIPEKPTPNRFRVVGSMNVALTAISELSNIIVNAAVHANDLDDIIHEVDNMSISEAEPVSVSQLVPIECPPTVEKLPADKRKVLEEKHEELKKFDNKWTKTVGECYDSDKLRQQLFNFKTDKNARISVRVFLSSTSAGLATNVAKLMRQFRGKSIVDGVHSGLQIGNTIIEWNQSGIVHIGELKYGNAVAVLFNVKDEKFDFTEENAQKMINFIQKWNTECQYSTKDFNSHRFVREFLQYTMNMSLVEKFTGPLGSYMDHVMKTGDVTPRLISKTVGTLVFKSHKDLEDKDRDIRDKLSEDELKLLKIFHRGFQLEEAANGQDVSSCCYGLPTNGLEILNDSGKPMNH